MLGDCASAPYPNSGATVNNCSFTHTELVGTATRKFNVMVPGGGKLFPGQSGMIFDVGNTGHGVELVRQHRHDAGRE
jgi:hypothetical protein